MLHMHMCAREDQRSMSSVFLNLSAPCLQIGSPPEPFRLDWLVCHPPGSVCLLPFPPALELQTCSTRPGFGVGARDLNSASGPASPLALKHLNQEKASPGPFLSPCLKGLSLSYQLFTLRSYQ